ncbi:unnamed protein product [Blepharisma stoltei]|uniref:Uncharacterized protein n=1 Tax=Blepharisma stoltei TaxID=1481888 RepID=A0AAU9JWG8_9CILI|nr:unnamed protein product [Blepharisma stoltei]
MSDTLELLNAKEEELSQLKSDFAEYQEMSKTLEEEIERELEVQIKLNSELNKENKALKDELDKLKTDHYEKFKSIEKNSNKVKDELFVLQERIKILMKNNKDLETELDAYKSKLREKDFEIDELTNSYHQTLEDLAITCSEFENLKDYSKENTQRLKEQLNELSQELDNVWRKTESIRNHSSNNENKTPQPSLKSSMVGRSALGMVDLLLSDLNSKFNAKQ